MTDSELELSACVTEATVSNGGWRSALFQGKKIKKISNYNRYEMLGKAQKED